MHVANLTSLFEQHLIVFAQRRTEYNACYALKTMNPLLSFRTLPSDVEHVNSKRGGSVFAGMLVKAVRTTAVAR